MTHKRGIAPLAVLIAWTLAATPTMSAESPDTPTTTSVSLGTADHDQAARFRKTLAFDATEATVNRAAADRTAYPDLTFGVPLSKAEAAEVLRRNQVALDIVPAIELASANASWAGVWIDHQSGGVPVFQFAGNAEGQALALEKALPRGTDYRLASVGRSISELERAKASVWDAADALRTRGIEITGVGIDTPGNRLRIGVLAFDATTEAALTDALGPDVEVHQQDYGTADACPETGCLPIKAGIGVTDANDKFPCTVGYLAKRTDTTPDQLVAITAGHCIKLGNKSSYWQHGGVDVGQVSTKGTGVYVHGYYNNSTADVGAFRTNRLSAANRRTRNLVLYSTGGTTADVIGYAAQSSQVVGTVVCRTGRTTDVKCGNVQDTSIDEYSIVWKDSTCSAKLYNYLIKDSVEYSIDGLGGDSGAPVYAISLPYPYDRYKATMYGTHFDSPCGSTWHSGWSGWYSAVDHGISRLQASFPGFAITMCTTATCGLPDPIGD